MARFFKTTKSDFVDKNTYQAPLELMAEVLQVKDAEVDDTFKKIDEFDLLLQDMNNLQIDDQAVNDTLNGYRGEVEELTNTLQGDIGNYQKQIPYINRLKRKITKDMQSGILKKAGDRYTERDTEFKRLDSIKDVNPKRIADIKEVLDIMDKESGGLNYKDENTYNKFIRHQINPEADFETEKFLTDLNNNFQADATSWASSKNKGNGFIKTASRGKKFVKESDVTDYITEYLNNSNFRSTNRQALELEGIKDGLRGERLQFYVDTELEKKEESLKKAAAIRVGYERQDASKSNLTVDALYAQRERRAWEVEDKVQPINTITKVERRGDNEVAKDSVIDNNFMSFAQDPKIAKKWGLNMKNEREFLKSMAAIKNKGQYKEFLDAYNLNEKNKQKNYKGTGKYVPSLVEPSEGLQYINRYNSRGYRVPLVDKDNKMSHLDYLNTTKAVTTAVLNKGLAQTQNITLVTNFGDTENPVGVKGSVLSLINNGSITLKTVGGEQRVENVESPIKVGNYWKDKNGNDVLVPVPEGKKESDAEKKARQEKSKNLSMEEAEALSNGGLKTQSVKNYIEEINKNPVLQSNVYRYQSANGTKDDYELEVPIRYKVNGKTVVGKAIIKTPTKDIEVIN